MTNLNPKRKLVYLHKIGCFGHSFYLFMTKNKCDVDLFIIKKRNKKYYQNANGTLVNWGNIDHNQITTNLLPVYIYTVFKTEVINNIWLVMNTHSLIICNSGYI